MFLCFFLAASLLFQVNGQYWSAERCAKEDERQFIVLLQVTKKLNEYGLLNVTYMPVVMRQLHAATINTETLDDIKKLNYLLAAIWDETYPSTQVDGDALARTDYVRRMAIFMKSFVACFDIDWQLAVQWYRVIWTERWEEFSKESRSRLTENGFLQARQFIFEEIDAFKKNVKRRRSRRETDVGFKRQLSLQETICQHAKNQDEAVIQKIMLNCQILLAHKMHLYDKDLFIEQLRVAALTRMSQKKRLFKIMSLWELAHPAATEAERQEMADRRHLLMSVATSLQTYWECNGLDGGYLNERVYGSIFDREFQEARNGERVSMIAERLHLQGKTQSWL